MAFCTKCGNQIREGHAFCTKCGAAVMRPDEVVQATEEDPVAEVIEEVVQAQAAEEDSTAEAIGAESDSTPDSVDGVEPEITKDPANEVPQDDQQTTGSWAAEVDLVSAGLTKAANVLKDDVARVVDCVKTFTDDTKSSFDAAKTEGNLNQKPNDNNQLGKLGRTNIIPIAASVLALLSLVILFSCGSASISGTSSSSTSSASASAKKGYKTHIKVKCNKNLLFSTYDVQIYVDDALVDTLDHGEEGSWDKELSEGSHKIMVCKKGDKSIDGTKSFSVTADSVLDCTVTTHSAQVEFKEFSCRTQKEIDKEAAEAEKKQQEEAQAKLEAQQYVPDGTGATYKVQFAVSGWINTLFLKARSINVYLDGSQVKAVADNESVEWEQDLGGGKHILRFASAEDDSVDVMQSFTVADISYLSCKASLGLGGIEIKDYSFETQAERDKAAEEARQKEAAEAEAKAKEEAEAAEAKAKKEAEAAEKAKVLTVDNCEDLANLLNSSSSDASSFAAAYAGRTIEFDGNIAYMSSHNGAKTRFDVLIYAGDYSETSAKGPHMQYKDVNYRNMGASGIDSVQMGLNVRIRAKVGSYNSSTDILNLTPVSMTAR